MFGLLTTLHTLETQACDVLPGDLRMLVGMRRSEMILHLPNPPDDAARQMDSFSLWLDRSQLWLATLRSHVYSVVESSAKCGLLYREDVLAAFLEAALTGLGEMSANNMKAFLRHVVAPFEQYMPRAPPGLPVATQNALSEPREASLDRAA